MHKQRFSLQHTTSSLAFSTSLRLGVDNVCHAISILPQLISSTLYSHKIPLHAHSARTTMLQDLVKHAFRLQSNQ
eukprot:3002106-Amphidinium_carterae.1